MPTHVDCPVEEQLVEVYQHLGLRRAHLLANMPRDFRVFVRTHSDLIASLSLLCPMNLDREGFREVNVPFQVITGEIGPISASTRQNIEGLPHISVVTLPNYFYQSWSDVAVEKTPEISQALLNFLDQVEASEPLGPVAVAAREGEVGDIYYKIRGDGAPLVLLPLALAPSQWDALVDTLSRRYCTITLTGKSLGFSAFLEARGQSEPFLGIVENLVNHAKLTAGQKMLEVGCGTGVLMRWLARRNDSTIGITAIDINRHFLQDARNFSKQEGLEGRIDFREGSAEKIPFADNTFDFTVSITVLEEVDADRAIAEMVRVTKPGGKVGIMLRSVDMARFINLPLPPELKAKLEAPGAWGGGVSPQGCADASLYPRMARAGLRNVKKLLRVAVNDAPGELPYVETNVLPKMSQEEAKQWRAAVAQVADASTFFHVTPYHCAIGAKV